MKRYKVYQNGKLIAQFDEEKDAIKKAKEQQHYYTWVEVIDSCSGECSGDRVYYWIY